PGCDHRVVRQQRQRTAGRAIRLADHFGQVLGILRRAAQVDTFGGEIDRPQLDVRFLEEAVRAERNLEQPRRVLAAGRGNDRGGQHDGVGVELQAFAQDRISGTYFQDSSAALLDRFNQRLVLRFVADELDILARGFAVVVLVEAVRSHVAEQHVDVDVLVDGLELERILHRAAAAHARTVVAVLLAAADALDHDHALRLAQLLVAADDFLLQLELGHDTGILSIQVFGRLVLVGAGGDDGGAVLDLLHPAALGFHLGGEVADVAIYAGDRGIGHHPDQLVPIGALLEVLQPRLHVQPFDREVDAARHAAEVGRPLDEVGLEALLGQREGAGHAGDAAAHHQRGLV